MRVLSSFLLCLAVSVVVLWGEGAEYVDAQSGFDANTANTALIRGSPPVVRDDYETVEEDTRLSSASYSTSTWVLHNDDDPDGDPLRVVSYTQPSHGHVRRASTSTSSNNYHNLYYTVDRDYHGPDSFTYSVSDGHHPPVNATVHITITPVNDPPGIQEIPVQRSDVGESIEIQVRASDVDDPRQVFHYGLQSIDGSSLPGGLEINDKGLITWTPTGLQKGTHTIQLQVSDDNSTSTQDIVFRIGKPDSIIEPIGVIGAKVGEHLQFQINTTADASLSLIEEPADSYLRYDGRFTWAPRESHIGPNTFTIKAVDNNGVIHTEEVTVIVHTAFLDNILTFAEIHDRTAFTWLPLSFKVFPYSIPEGRAALFSLSGAPDGASIDSYTGVFRWAPTVKQMGQHTFTINARAGSNLYSERITVTVHELPTPIINFTTGYNNATFNITSDNDESYNWLISEKDSQIIKFTGSFALSDANRIVERTIRNLSPNTVYSFQLLSSLNETIGVDFQTEPRPGSPPVARDDHIIIQEDYLVYGHSGWSATVRPLENDADPDGDPIEAYIFIPASHGTIRSDPFLSNVFLYTVDANYHGQDSFTYVVSDGHHYDVGTVNITITPVNDAPNIQNTLGGQYGVGQSIIIPIHATDVDSPIESLTYTLQRDEGIPRGATIDASGVFTWVPTEDQIGRYGMEIVVSDGIADTSLYDTITISKNYVELDKNSYGWTDKVRITIVAPDHNRDNNRIETIGNTSNARVRIDAFSGDDLHYANHYLNNYTLIETGDDTGIFTGMVTLTGFSSHDADGNGRGGDASGDTIGTGPTDGRLRADTDTFLEVQFVTDEGSIWKTSPISWDIGQVEWKKQVYPENGTAIVSVTDPDMNLNQEEPDSIFVDVSSDSDRTGIKLTLIETAGATGIFEGTIHFASNPSSGDQLLAQEGDTVTAVYNDRTLPEQYNDRRLRERYGRYGDIHITATTAVGNVITLDHIDYKTVRAQSALVFQATATDALGQPLIFDLTNSPPEGAIIHAASGDFRWTPSTSQIGTHTFAIIVYDQQKRSTYRNITVIVSEPNQNPAAPDIQLTTYPGSSTAIRLGVNDPDGDETTMELMTEPTKGRIMKINHRIADIIYRANPNERGIDFIDYTVSDDHGGTATGTIIIIIEQFGSSPTVIAPVSDASVGSVLEAYMSLGLVVFTGTMLGYEDINYTIFEDITHTVSEDGTVSIGVVRPAIPNAAPGFTGNLATGDATRSQIGAGFLYAGIIINVTDTGPPGAGIANYALSDGDGQNGNATMSVFIREIDNVPPILSPVGDYRINAQETLTFRVPATDFGSDTLSYRLSGAPASATISRQGDFRWAPGSLDVGNHNFTIIAYGRQGATDTETVAIRVLPAGTSNEPPTALNATATVARDSLVTIIPAITDPDGDRTRITDATGTAGGTIMQSDNSIEYIAGSAPGTETITYTVTDSRNAKSTGTITITIQ